MLNLNNNDSVFDDAYDWDYGSDYVSEREWEENRKALSDSHEPNGDTHYRMTLDQYIQKIESLDFELVLAETFTHSNCGRERPDSFYLFAHRDGWLIELDTYTFDNGFHEGVDQGFSEPSANTVTLHYNWQPEHIGLKADLTSNGGFIHRPHTRDDAGNVIEYGDRMEPAVWSGYHDVREGLEYTMNSLKSTGTILNPWKQNTINWMCPHHAVKEQDRGVLPGQTYKAEWDRWVHDMNTLSQSYFEKLPDWVKSMIGKSDR